MVKPAIIRCEAPGDAEREAILKLLIAYNDTKTKPANAKPLAILLRDPASEETVGGLWGKVSYDWLYVELLIVPERYRSQDLGTDLMRRAEEFARDQGCIGVWLNTFEFQALSFYQKNGYSLFGTLDDRPQASKFYFLQKRFDPSQA
ncbi:GNAT family N-acetyltransferase [Microvirga pudoricolor]|uniref:GNAT family N-acetyltransferase n=1 Tax=Microvirga pudoricolor TaxID=2778729 RepID=UPI001951A7A1|nr:GNAT family N-acetyltransferase [Microvirga pudoricolor]MBM6595775.1 GNAT family N-acetyltransferase [Microvirga pudoricolor]